MVVVRCVKTVMSTNGFTNIKMGLGAAGNQIGAGIAGGANAVNNTAASCVEINQCVGCISRR